MCYLVCYLCNQLIQYSGREGGCGSTEFALGSVGDWLVPNIEDRPWFSGVGCKEVRLDLLLPFLGGGTSFIHGINLYIR